MSHAEKCPVCDGSGCTDDGIEPRIFVDCHGCDGKGWVEVGLDRKFGHVHWCYCDIGEDHG